MSESKNLKDRPGRGGKDQRSRADEKIGSGPHGKKKVIVQPSGSDNSGGLAQRGMSSEEAGKMWGSTSGPHKKGR
jgi:hypothetical protein